MFTFTSKGHILQILFSYEDLHIPVVHIFTLKEWCSDVDFVIKTIQKKFFQLLLLPSVPPAAGRIQPPLPPQGPFFPFSTMSWQRHPGCSTSTPKPVPSWQCRYGRWPGSLTGMMVFAC